MIINLNNNRYVAIFAGFYLDVEILESSIWYIIIEFYINNNRMYKLSILVNSK